MSLRKTEFHVGPADRAADLLGFLTLRLNLSRRGAKLLLDRRRVFVNDRRVWMARHPLRPRDRVAVFLDAAPPAETRPPRTLWNDGRTLVADKPAGLLANGPDSAESLLRAATGNAALRAVHRLDRDTSGCLLFAANDACFTQLVALFREGRVQKLYRAIAAGRVSGETTIDRPIENRTAVTRLLVLDANRQASHLQVKIETGRTHQIRRHLAMIRHPILGDASYGPSGALDPLFQAIPRQMLHAFRLEYPDPETGAIIRAEAALPRDFRTVLKQVGLT